jgi:hypothetical protein
MRKVLPILLILLGVGVFAVGVVNAVSGVASSLNTVGEQWRTPGESTSQLEPGGYVVYESAGITDATSARVTIDPDSITVSGPAGAVPVTCISCGSTKTTVTLGDATYVGVVSFTADTAGSYTVAATDSGATLVLGPSVSQTLVGAFRGVGLAMLGGFISIVGVVWLIVAAVLGRRKPEPAAATGYYGMSPAPGHPASTAPMQNPDQIGSWYPDPEDPNQLRWWDGRQWTEHRRPR